jgi:hypothetical protein
MVVTPPTLRYSASRDAAYSTNDGPSVRPASEWAAYVALGARMRVSAWSHAPADSVKRATAAREPGALSTATNSSEVDANTNVHGLSEPGVPVNPGRFTSLPEFQHGVELVTESPWRSW